MILVISRTILFSIVVVDPVILLEYLAKIGVTVPVCAYAELPKDQLESTFPDIICAKPPE